MLPYWVGSGCKWVGSGPNPNPKPVWGFTQIEQRQQQPWAAAAARVPPQPARALRLRAPAARRDTSPAPLLRRRRRCSGAQGRRVPCREEEREGWGAGPTVAQAGAASPAVVRVLRTERKRVRERESYGEKVRERK